MNKKCQVFTPYKYVLKLLDSVGYKNNLYGKKILENACGDGNILKIIVERYIKDCLKKSFPIHKIKTGLENDIYASEIDAIHYFNCTNTLDKIAKQYGITRVKWKIINSDILKEDLNLSFDFIVGNPPYINYTELDKETRHFVRNNFQTCRKGKFDYCYAFIESGLKLLNNGGKFSYLIPNSIFKNVFAQELRDFMLTYLDEIIDYKTQQIFDALTSSAIILCSQKEKINTFIKYSDMNTGEQIKIPKANLVNKWMFSNEIQDSKRIAKKIIFGDYFTAAISIATQLNEAYVIDNYNVFENYIEAGGKKIEKSILKPAYSPRGMNSKKDELIIFPYIYKRNKLFKYETEEFESKFPKTVSYLKSFSKKLKARKAYPSAKWFEYGRIQALSNLNQEKLMLSTVVTNTVKVYSLKKEDIPYSGIFVITNKKAPLSLAKKILESKLFLEYVKKIGTNASGKSLRITPADINQYEFYLEGNDSWEK